MEADYNTKEGIAKSIGSLEELAKLLSERHHAWGRDEELSEFFILGRYRLDNSGHMEKMAKKKPLKIFFNTSMRKGIFPDIPMPKEIFPNIPDVMTKDEFIDYIEKHPGKLTKDDLRYHIVYESMEIEPGLKCPSCGLVWDISNIHEAQISRGCKWLPLDDFVGKTLDEVIEALNKKRDGRYSFGPSDHRDEDYIAQPGQSLWTSIIRLSHSECNKK